MEPALNIVVLLNSPEDVRRQYREGIPAGADNVSVQVINDVDEIDPHLATMDVLMTYGTFLRDRAEHVFGHSPRLRWIQALGSGIDNLRPARNDIVITCIRGIHDSAVSEAAFSGMLALSRNLPQVLRNQQARNWERLPSRLLDGKCVGMLGVGLIAEALARRCKAFGMTVVGITSRTSAVPGFDQLRPRRALLEAVADLDILVVLAPYTADNHHLVDAATLAAMKPGSFLVNVARGGVVDEAALLRSLQSGHIAGAALDVFAEEPLADRSPFWTMPNVIVTPHVAGMNVDYVQRALPIILANIHAFRANDIARMKELVHAGGDAPAKASASAA
ncbi:MAG TPA: D-2-hydroxyacid dehydrogenase [Xanthobacteraceae bacterium]|nr:D-2-hydroxyacid dehydrogenase [Xanthobacteraceae bacterium]